jgi:hypothetical protein
MGGRRRLVKAVANHYRIRISRFTPTFPSVPSHGYCRASISRAPSVRRKRNPGFVGRSALWSRSCPKYDVVF